MSSKKATKQIYNHKEVESKWQKRWATAKLYTQNVNEAKKKFYNLMMFPYPSAEGLHAGNMFAFTGSDVFGRFKRMQGFDVFEPIGLDGFGIHSENYALKIGKSPKEHARISQENYYKQLHKIGNSFDWTRTLETYDPDYYKWTQWLFIQMFKAGLAYKKKAPVNFCPGCKTVLADEQIMSPAQAGKLPKGYDSLESVPEGIKVCERCGSIPERRELEQWFFAITKYAERLLSGLDKIDWSERVKLAQKNWIGKSEGMIINFGERKVFTTRPDTLESAAFIAVASGKVSETKEKAGKFTGNYVINPLTGKELPVWEANYVDASYGTGVIMGVPAYDARDMEFAKKYGLEIVKKKLDEGLWQKIEKKGWGKKHTNYHLRDWLVSRQRYWGPPIPMIYCQKCGWQPVPEKDLPVELPELKDYQPEGTGHGPLAHHPEFYEAKCPNCGGDAKRETDVSDTFVDSAWYFLRYPTVGGSKAGSHAFDTDITKKWLPVDLYFGGAEHAVLHLMYARFVTMVLHDLKLLDFEEPFPKFFAHGLMIKDGAKMSKSRGNVVNPDKYIEKFGSDTLRLYLMFMGPMDGYPDFRDTGIEGMQRFINRVWNLFDVYSDIVLEGKNDSKEVMVRMHQTIKKITNDIQQFRYNTAIASIMEFVNLLYDKAIKAKKLSNGAKIRCAEWDSALETLTLLLAPFAPHIAEEIWNGNLKRNFSVHTNPWPKFDKEFVREDTLIVVIQINGKVRDQFVVDNEKLEKEKLIKKAKDRDIIKKWLKSKKIKNVVYVERKLVNFVTD